MSNLIQSFTTISGASGPFIYREKQSKFLGYAFPAPTKEAAERALEKLKKQYADASHVCYAYRIGVDNTLLKAHDDGEPAHTAGSPILGQITSFDFFNILVCVVRYYGGVKLGAGGLAQAYKEASKGALEEARALKRRAACLLRIQFQYESLDEVMSFISQNRVQIRSQQMELDCHMELVVSPDKSSSYCSRLKGIRGVQVNQKKTYL
jgi:uncharacterized YigZ family protein